MNEISTEKTMTTKELAEILGVDVKTIQRTADKLFDINVVKSISTGGRPTKVFNEAQATAIKIELQNHSKIAQNGFDTFSITNDLEAWELQKRLDAYKDRRIAELTAENAEQKAIIDRIENGKGCYSINQTAKALKLPFGNIKLFELLRNNGILNSDNSPRQEQINAGHFKVVVKFINETVGNKPVTLTTGKGLVYLAKRLKTDIDTNICADA